MTIVASVSEQADEQCSDPPSDACASRDKLSTLRRGIEILKALQQAAYAGRDSLGNNQIATMLDMNKSQVSRTLKVLVDSGLVARDQGTRGYRLGPAAYSLGMRAADQELIRCGSAVIREVVRVTKYRAYLVIREGTRAITLWSEQPTAMQPVVNSMGMEYPISQSETGRALLFGFSDISIRRLLHDESKHDVDTLITHIQADRREGFAWRPDYGLEGGVAVPVWASGRRVVAAIGVGNPELADRGRALGAARVLTAAGRDLTSHITRADRRSIQAVPYLGWPQVPGVIFGRERS